MADQQRAIPNPEQSNDSDDVADDVTNTHFSFSCLMCSCHSYLLMIFDCVNMFFHKLANLCRCVSRAMPNYHSVAYALQVFDNGLLLWRQPASLGPLHLDPQPPRWNMQIRNARHNALGPQPLCCADCPMSAVWYRINQKVGPLGPNPIYKPNLLIMLRRGNRRIQTFLRPALGCAGLPSARHDQPLSACNPTA